MNKLDFLFNYLATENFQIDKKEFDYQFNSHPNFPSLLAISDTLSFFNINNGALKISPDQIELLPDNFIAQLKYDEIYYHTHVERKGDKFIYFNEESKKLVEISIEELASIWDNIVLLVEQDENVISNSSNSKSYHILNILFLVVLAVFMLLTSPPIEVIFFYLFSVTGLILSLGALKDLLGGNNKFLSKFCDTGGNSSCEDVVNSSKWKFFKYLNFSDLSIIFFATQIVTLFLMSYNGLSDEFFLIQFVLLTISLPIVFSSIYYQKFVEKKWCFICLSIIGVIIAELGYILSIGMSSDLVGLSDILFYSLIGLFILAIWFPLKGILVQTKELKEAELNANRFKRNYKIFKNLLVSKPKYQLIDNPVTLGNSNAELRIDFITSPYCAYCSESHKMLKNILDNNDSHIAVSVIYNFDIDNNEDEDTKSLYRNLLNIKIQEGDEKYMKAVDDWIRNKNHRDWLRKYNSECDTERIDSILRTQYQWCNDNKFNFTPCLLINGYRFPDVYDNTDLKFFINELSHDKTIKILKAETEKLY
jgi:uncharacterized membrane protein